MNKLLIIFLAGLFFSSAATSAIWYDINGVLVSDTCVSPSGYYFIFDNLVMPVNTPCHFVVNGYSYNGKFG